MLHKCLFLTAIILCSTIATVDAQTDSVQNRKRENSLQNGKLALQFQITNSFSLTSFQGAVLSGKKQISDNAAVRLGVGLGVIVNSGMTETKPQNNDSVKSLGENNTGNQNINIGLQYLLYPSPEAEINFFFGGGVVAGYSRFNTSTKSTQISGAAQYELDQKTEGSGWNVGATGVVGAEWFATKSISFLAEYGILLNYFSQDETSTATSTDAPIPTSSSGTRKTRDFTFTPLQVKFGLSLYF